MILFSTPYGGGVEYLHRDPESRRRRRKGSFESETVKYGRESQGTRTREWLRWRGPVAIVNDRPVFSSERAPQNNKPATVRQLKSGRKPQIGALFQDRLAGWPSVVT
jgi:hypothetical protein